MRAYVGTSGWQYADWKGDFYPAKLPQKEWLPYFSERFPTVEVNNTFYMLPKPETFVRWREASADDFVFVVKANRYITHIRRLKDAAEPLRRFNSHARRLGRKLGPILYQLPPNLKADVELLERFLRLLPKTQKAAFEFRHESWETNEVRKALDRRGCALVIPDRPGDKPRSVVTGGWSYLRFHQGRPTAPGYTRSKLSRYADAIARMDAEEIWIYFNNDPTGAAVRDSYTLTEMLEEREVSVRGPVREPAARAAGPRPA